MDNFVRHRARDHKLWRLIAQTKDAIFKARMKELYQYNVSSWEAGITYRIHVLADKAIPAEISRWLLREPHTVSAVLSRMQREGIVTKVKDMNRKNMIRVVLTDKGHELLKRASKRESIHRVLSVLSQDERRQLQSLLYKLRNKALEELGVDPQKIRV